MAPDAKSWLIGKDPDAGEDWRQEEKGMTEDEMVGWHHWLDGHEFEQAPGDGEGQGSLAYQPCRGKSSFGAQASHPCVPFGVCLRDLSHQGSKARPGC